MTKAPFDIRTEATRPLYAGLGATDRAVEVVRDYVADVQKRFAGVQKALTESLTRGVSEIDLQPHVLREQARTLAATGVEVLSKDAKERRAAIEARVAELQSEAQTLVTESLGHMSTVYADLAKRGEVVVARMRQQETAAPRATAGTSSTTATAGAAATTAKPAVKKTTARKPAAKKTAAKPTAKKAAPKADA